METEPGAAWTLVVSWSLKNKDFSSFRYNIMREFMTDFLPFPTLPGFYGVHKPGVWQKVAKTISRELLKLFLKMLQSLKSI